MRDRRKKKRVSGLIIRLVDVVLILLFGFISISELGKKTKIQLATSTSVPANAPDRETVLFVGVLPDGQYLVADETRSVRDMHTLGLYILREQKRYRDKSTPMRVRVRANHDAPVEYAFSVVNMCQNMNIPVGLDVIKIRR